MEGEFQAGIIVQIARRHPKQDFAMPDQSATSDHNAELQQHLKEMFNLARSGEATTLARLLDLGVPANLRNEKGDTLLMLACYHGHLDAARVLLEHGADTELYNDNGQLPLAAAAFKDYRDIAELLLANGARVDGAAPDGRTALMMAAMFNRTGIVELMLAHGADPHARNAKGLNARELAESMGAPETVVQLAALGA
jgi:ankyrin repeat protein